MSDSFDLGGGGNAFPFDAVGDSVSGRIISITEENQTDMDTGEVATWDNGQPKRMLHIELQTDLRDPDRPEDDGKRSVYLRGSRKKESQSSMAAVLSAVVDATRSTKIAVGASLTLTFTGEGVPTRRGWNPPKFYSASYVPPQVDLSGPGAASSPAAPAQVPAAPPATSAADPTPEQIAAFQQWKESQGA